MDGSGVGGRPPRARRPTAGLRRRCSRLNDPRAQWAPIRPSVAPGEPRGSLRALSAVGAALPTATSDPCAHVPRTDRSAASHVALELGDQADARPPPQTHQARGGGPGKPSRPRSVSHRAQPRGGSHPAHSTDHAPRRGWRFRADKARFATRREPAAAGYFRASLAPSARARRFPRSFLTSGVRRPKGRGGVDHPRLFHPAEAVSRGLPARPRLSSGMRAPKTTVEGVGEVVRHRFVACDSRARLRVHCSFD